MYPTDLTDSHWEVIKVYLPLQRKRRHSLRKVLDGMLYLLKTGCQWRLLPKEFPDFQLVYYYFYTWTRNGVLEQINQALNRLYRQQMEREASPSLAIIDAQSVKNSERGLPDKGFDGHKRIQGRKRHLAVDTLGLVLAVSYSPANEHDSKGAISLLTSLFKQGYERITTVLADSAYSGPVQEWCKNEFNWQLNIATAVKGIQKGFEVQPQRWKVERNISWLQWNRRLAKDYEDRFDSGVTFVLLDNIKRVLGKIKLLYLENAI